MARSSKRRPAADLFAAPDARLHPPFAGRRPAGRPRSRRHRAAEVSRGDDVKVWFPIQRGLLRRTVGHVKAVDGISLSGARRRDRGRGRRKRLRQDHPWRWRFCGCRRATGGFVFMGRRSGLVDQPDAPLAGRCRSFSRTPSAASAPACRSPRSLARGCACIRRPIWALRRAGGD